MITLAPQARSTPPSPADTPPQATLVAAPQPRRSRLVRLTLAIALLAVLWPWLADGEGQAAETEGLSVVTRGAHLLALEPVDGRHPRVAYLPVGTIVAPTGRIEELSIPSGIKRPFEAVTAQSGASGFLRTSLFTSIGPAHIAVPVSSTELPLFYKPLASLDQVLDDEDNWVCPPDLCFFFSRTGGVWLTIGPDVGDYYEVTLHRTLTKVADGPDLAKEESNRFLLKAFVETGRVKIIDQSSAATSMTAWEQKEEPRISLDPEAVVDLLEKIKGDGENIEKSVIWCNSEVNANGELGFDVWFAKASLGGSITTKEKGRFQTTERIAQSDTDPPVVYDLHRDIECKNAAPERTTKLVVEAGGAEEFRVDLDRLKSVACPSGQSCESSIHLKNEGEPYDKMVVVSDWPSYNAMLHQLEAVAGEIAPSGVSDDAQIQTRIIERQNLYDFILREIAIFRDP